MEQQVYRSKHGSERPTAQQQALLEKMGVRQPIIGALNRQEAFELIRKVLVRYYGAKAERYLQGRGVIKW